MPLLLRTSRWAPILRHLDLIVEIWSNSDIFKDWTSATYHCLSTMSKHNPDLILCRHLAGISIGRLCENDDGRCPICDSYVRPTTLVRICDDCAYHNGEGGNCIICGGVGVSDAYYCAECTRLEMDRDGCPRVINLGSSKKGQHYERIKKGDIKFERDGKRKMVN